MTEDLNKRVIDLMTDLFNKAAEQSADADAIGDAVADAVEDAISDKIGYSEVITEDNFNDWLEDADALSGFVCEDYVDDAIMHVVEELESDFVTTERALELIAAHAVTIDVINQMMRDLEAAKLSNRIKSRVARLFTLTRRSIKSLLSIRLSFRQVEG